MGRSFRVIFSFTALVKALTRPEAIDAAERILAAHYNDKTLPDLLTVTAEPLGGNQVAGSGTQLLSRRSPEQKQKQNEKW